MLFFFFRIHVENLSRFLEAQLKEYKLALSEVKNGKKVHHWMWYIFPQVAGLGFSETSKYYSIKNREEAIAYLDHPVLGNRLKEISNELLRLKSSNATAVFGTPDDIKLKSCMTLFATVEKERDNVFVKVLEKFFNGEYDHHTIGLLNMSR